MSVPLTRERVLQIIEEEKQNLQDDLCNSKKHTLGKKADLIGKGLRVCCKKTNKDYIVSKRVVKRGKPVLFVLRGSEDNELDPITADQLLQGYRLD